jgi:ATP-binding cassette subfamily F protein 2
MARGGKKSKGTTPVVEGAAEFPVAAGAAAGGEAGHKHESGANVNHAPCKFRENVPDVIVTDLDIAFHGVQLLEGAQLELFPKHRYGLVGPNGCGKSTLLRALGCGEIGFPPCLDYFHVKEEIEASHTMTALEAVLSLCAAESARLEKQLESLASAEDADALMEQIYERLDELDPATAEVRASKILFGLGFTDDMQARVTSSFSGGWRMRIALAQALFQGPTLLLLDEPTNHLDIEAVVWLEGYLAKFNKILLMVSHSQDFMNVVCTDIIHLQQKKLVYYDGNYDQYVATRENLETNQMKRFETEQKQIDHMKDYIRRFEHANEKRSRQAQSKMKVLEKLERGGLVEEVEQDANINFHFQCGGALPPPIIQFTDVGFNYPNCPKLYRGLNLGVTSDSRICLVGPNGAGKTTLTKMMIRELDATEGTVAMSPYCKIARFHQHFVDLIDMELSPLAWFQSEFPLVKDPTPLRSALGRFGISGLLQGVPMKTLSDGQKSRVVLAWMSNRAPHLMILDEPTNHLDIESIDALAEGINDFEGAVIVVSHDLRLIAQIAKEIWICEKGKVQRFNGDIADYKKYVQHEVARMEADHNKSQASKAVKPAASKPVATKSKVGK